MFECYIDHKLGDGGAIGAICRASDISHCRGPAKFR